MALEPFGNLENFPSFSSDYYDMPYLDLLCALNSAEENGGVGAICWESRAKISTIYIGSRAIGLLILLDAVCAGPGWEEIKNYDNLSLHVYALVTNIRGSSGCSERQT
jgi:hypothetical protein